MSALPVEKPIIATRPKPQLRVEQGTRPSVASNSFGRVIAFGALSLAVFFSSSLAGQVMVEKARREGMRAVQRAKDATKEEALLRDKVQALTRESAIDAWATANGFVALEALNAKSASTDDDSDAQTVH